MRRRIERRAAGILWQVVCIHVGSDAGLMIEKAHYPESVPNLFATRKKGMQPPITGAAKSSHEASHVKMLKDYNKPIWRELTE
jgi:hypothetical protein